MLTGRVVSNDCLHQFPLTGPLGINFFSPFGAQQTKPSCTHIEQNINYHLLLPSYHQMEKKSGFVPIENLYIKIALQLDTHSCHSFTTRRYVTKDRLRAFYLTSVPATHVPTKHTLPLALRRRAIDPLVSHHCNREMIFHFCSLYSVFIEVNQTDFPQKKIDHAMLINPTRRG